MTALADPSPSLSAEHRTLFEGKDLALDVYDGGHPISIVTFDPRKTGLGPSGRIPFEGGFGRGVFSRLGFNEYLVKRSWNHWYQTAEIAAVASIINSHARGTRVVTYGASMGGFAAVNFAALLNADSFIALSPLHDIAPDGEARDPRPWSERRVLEFTHNLISGGQNQRATGYVFYTSGHRHDRPHAELIGRDTDATVVGVEYGGHPCSYFLNDVYGLKRLISEIATGTLDLDDFSRVVEENTPETMYPYDRRADELMKNEGNLTAAIEQVRLAISKKPGLPRLHTRLGDLLRRVGDFDSAEEAYRASIALLPGGTMAHIGLSYVFAARADFASAVQAVDAAIENAPNHKFYSRRGEWQIRQGDLEGAEQSFLKVTELVPDAAVAMKRLTAVRARIAARNKRIASSREGRSQAA